MFCQGGVGGDFVKGCRWRFCQGGLPGSWRFCQRGLVRDFVKGVWLEVLSRGCSWRFCQGGVVRGFVKGV